MRDAPSWVPAPNERSAPFYEGARRGELRLQRCGGCRAWLHPVRARCPHCGGVEITWEAASGRGRVYSHALLHRAYHPRHEGRLPLVLATIDLDEGVRLSSNVVGVEEGEVRAGLPVEVAFEHLSDEVALPVFRPARP